MAKPTSKRRVLSKSSRPATRSQHIRLLDVEEEDEALKFQLKSLGLYEADTKGDGNCLFRALSDQIYGNSSSHLMLRREVCDYIESKADKYKAFIDEDSVRGGFVGHVANMRIQGSYGTHIELSAFAQLYRPVTVIQKGMIYVVGVDNDTSPPPPLSSNHYVPAPPSPIKKSAKARGKIKAVEQNTPYLTVSGNAEIEEDDESGPICIAYHTWEHYTSIRNLSGPHTGLPRLKAITNLTTHSSTPETSSTPPIDPELQDLEEDEFSSSSSSESPPFSISALHPHPYSSHSRNSSSLQHLHPTAKSHSSSHQHHSHNHHNHHAHSNSNLNFSSGNEDSPAPSTPTSSIPDSPEAEEDLDIELLHGDQLDSTNNLGMGTRGGISPSSSFGSATNLRSSQKRNESPVNHTSDREGGTSSSKGELPRLRLRNGNGRTSSSGSSNTSAAGKIIKERGLTRRQRRTEELKNVHNGGGGGKEVVAQQELEKMKMLFI